MTGINNITSSGFFNWDFLNVQDLTGDFLVGKKPYQPYIIIQGTGNTTISQMVVYDPTFGDMPPGQPKTSTVLDSDYIGRRASNPNGDQKFCESLGHTLNSSTRVGGADHITIWNETQARRGRRNTDEERFDTITCDVTTVSSGSVSYVANIEPLYHQLYEIKMFGLSFGAFFVVLAMMKIFQKYF